MGDPQEVINTPIIDTKKLIDAMQGSYLNEIVSKVNDHVVRLSVMTEPYFWHLHPESDETFIMIEGQIAIAFADREIVLSAGEIMTIPKGVAHRTRPVGQRSVNLTVENAALTTVRIDVAQGSNQ